MSRIVETIETAVDIIERLQNAGYQAVFAGGCVRDMLLGVEPKDFDIATSATPDQVEALFEKTVAVGKSFGVIRVIHDGEEFEVATFRSDGQYTDGRRPDDVRFGEMQEDAFRRDLTINAMFFDPIGDKIHDWVFGQRDLKDRIIRFVGNPDERIREDKLRMLRVIRFASRKGGWAVNRDTWAAIAKNADKIGVVSAERIADELTKIFTQPTAGIGYEKLHGCGLLAHVLPDAPFHKGVLKSLINANEKLVNNKVLAWALVLSACPAYRKVMADLRFDNKTSDAVAYILERDAAFLNAKSLKGSDRMKLIANENFDNNILFLRLAHEGDGINVNEIADYLIHIKASSPKGQIHPEKLVDGNDLIAMGLKAGKQFKEILAKVNDEQREGRITTRDEALAYVKNALQISA